jgi:hypothetical protein
LKSPIIDHNYALPDAEILKKRIQTCSLKMTEMKRKLRCEEQKKRRYKKKITYLSEVIEDLRKKR